MAVASSRARAVIGTKRPRPNETGRTFRMTGPCQRLCSAFRSSAPQWMISASVAPNRSNTRKFQIPFVGAGVPACPSSRRSAGTEACRHERRKSSCATLNGYGNKGSAAAGEIDGVTVFLAHPDELPMRWIGQQELLLQLHACWRLIDERDLPLSPRLIGKPGVGKTTLAYAAARMLDREVYIFQATMDTRPEDLLITPVVADDRKIQYVASPVVSAMITGGVAILDEGNRMSEKSWASLAPLLDTRRYVESIVAGIKVKAHPDFRIVATMNDDASTFEIPEYIHTRLQPQIYLDFPDKEEELAILRENLPFVDEKILAYVADFLEKCHLADEAYTVRDGINVARYVAKRLSYGMTDMTALLREALVGVLGEAALRYLE